MLVATASAFLQAQQTESAAAKTSSTMRFLAERRAASQSEAAASLAQSLLQARAQHARMLAQPRGTSLTAAWQPLGPAAVASATYGRVTGRVTSVALDSNDTTGNTLYLGTTGGGVWKSTNAAGPLASVNFTPLTDTLPVFSPAAAIHVVPSLSIGAVSVQPLSNPVVLAGTGDPNDASDSYYGEGILRSADGGLTWTLAQGTQSGTAGSFSFLGLSVAGFAWSTATPTLVVAALSSSAEGSLVGASNITTVPGLYYSTDAGATWQMSSVYDGANPVQRPLSSGTVGNPATSVVWDALRQRFYAAVRAHGFYESADGITWKRLASQPGTGLTTAVCPAVFPSATCPLERGVLAVQSATGDIYALSVDGANGDNGLWQDLCSATGTTCATAAPVFAHRIDAGAMETGPGSTAIANGTYNLTLAAAPSGSGTLLVAGTTDLFRCVISAGTSACALRNTTNATNGCATPAGVAPSQHTLAMMPLSNGSTLLFTGNDGGLWRSLDGIAQNGATCNSTDAQHFDNLNGTLGSLAEVTGFAQHPVDPDTLLAGLGANGTAATSTASSAWLARTAWAQLATGDGSAPLIDLSTPANWYVASGIGVSLSRCTLGSACTAANFIGTPTIGATQVGGDASLLRPPALLDPAQTSNLILGTCRVWRGPASGSGWSAANDVSKAFSGDTGPCVATSAMVRSLAAGGPVVSSTNPQNAGSTVLYAGMAGSADGGGTLGGHLFVTTAGATANSSTLWTDAAKSPVTNSTQNGKPFNPLGFDMSSVTVDTHDPTGATVYATVMGFGSGSVVSPRVYRSTDFGAHWLDLSSNLPTAPANALVVDPNDANTVYIALDTGVYVATQITTCAGADCWSVMGSALPNSPVTALAAAAAMPTGDGRVGLLRAGTYGRGLWSTPLLTALPAAQPAIILSASSLTFAVQAVGTRSATQTVTVTNSGSAPLMVSSLVVSGDFAETDTCTGQAVASGSTCTVLLTFAPTATGTRSGLTTIYANVAAGQAAVSLTGTATAPAPATITLSPSSLSFPATVVNQTAAAQIVIISNTGGTTTTLAAPVVTGDFALAAGTCGATLAAQSGCSLSITFTPTASGARTGTLSVGSGAGTQAATLMGTGNAPASDALSATSLSFAATQIGGASAAQQVILTNAGDATLTLVNAATSGPFTATSTCASSLVGKTSCAISVAFVPTSVGSASGTLTVSDQFRSQTVALSGIGLAPAQVSLTPVAGLAFGNIGVGLTSSPQTMTLTNNGGVALNIATISVSGDFHPASNNCPATLAVGSACTLQIVFTPTTPGGRSGALTITDNAQGGVQTAALTGAGLDFTFVASGSTSATITSGASAIFPMLLSSVAGVSGTAALACSGAPAHSVCTVSPANVSLGTTTSVVVTVQTGTAQAQLLHPAWLWRGQWVAFALLTPLCIFGLRRRRPRVLVAMLCSVALIAFTGCGTPRDIPASGTGVASTPTASGSYPLTVTAVSAGVSHSVTLTLIVQ